LRQKLRERRQVARVNPFAQWFDDPIGFVEEHLLGFLWSKQREIAQALVTHRRVAVKSCHTVGKTALAGRLAAWWIATRPPGQAFLITTAPTWPQVRNLLWREIRHVHASGRLPGELNLTEWWLGDQLVGFGRKPDDQNPTAMQGVHARYVLAILDEACGVAKTICDAVDTMISNEDSKILAIGNPDDPATEFAEMCKPGSGYEVIRVSAFSSPNFTGEKVPAWLSPLLVGPTWVEERKKRWGETSPIYISKIEGEFPDQSDDGLVSLAQLRAAVERDLPDVAQPNVLGVDVARFGNDATIVYHRRGNVARRVGTLRNRDLMQTCGLVVKCARDTGADRVQIDDIGLGGGVTDRLRELRDERGSGFTARVVPINVGAAPTEDATADVRDRRVTEVDEAEAPKTKFLNSRAELNWSLRDRFAAGTIALRGDLDDLMAQAAAIRYQLTSSGKILIEPKAKMKERGLPSPDEWDALVLAFAEVQSFDDSYSWVGDAEDLKKMGIVV
jgi:hypothetical protein